MKLLLTFNRLDAAVAALGESDQKRNMSERSELVSFPDFPSDATGTRRAAARGRLLLLTFLGETRKVSSCGATPRLRTPTQPTSHSLQKQIEWALGECACKRIPFQWLLGACACKHRPFRRQIACDLNSLLHPPAYARQSKPQKSIQLNSRAEGKCACKRIPFQWLLGACACKHRPFRRQIACDPNSLLHPLKMSNNVNLPQSTIACENPLKGRDKFKLGTYRQTAILVN
ncbi:hypothetical protein BH11PSE11_BH11PSE11_19510 [soil metagenome]